MPRTRNSYPAEFRDQIIALHRAGRSIRELAAEFEPCTETIYAWIKQSDRDGGRRAVAEVLLDWLEGTVDVGHGGFYS